MPTARQIQTRACPQGVSRVTLEDRRRQERILLERGTTTAAACARKHGVSHWTVRQIWGGRRWTPEIRRHRALVLRRQRGGAWIPATKRDDRLMARLVRSGRLAGGLAELVAAAAEHGLAVVFRGDIGA